MISNKYGIEYSRKQCYRIVFCVSWSLVGDGQPEQTAHLLLVFYSFELKIWSERLSGDPIETHVKY